MLCKNKSLIVYKLILCHVILPNLFGSNRSKRNLIFFRVEFAFTEKTETIENIEKLRKLTPSQSYSRELNLSTVLNPIPDLNSTLGLNNNQGKVFTLD